jgi:hypothetical protein
VSDQSIDQRPWWWLEFEDADGDHLGVAIVRGENVVQAASSAHREGCNPGGTVWGEQLEGDIEARFANRLVTEESDLEAVKTHAIGERPGHELYPVGVAEFMDEPSRARIVKALGNALNALLDLRNVLDEVAEEHPALLEEHPGLMYDAVVELAAGLVGKNPEYSSGSVRLCAAADILARGITRGLYTGGQSALARTN